jgi:prepilin-type N-terminal cleavage/methylation domain-containing protein
LRKCRKAFTLVEVVAAAALAGVALVALMQIVPGMLKVGTKVEVITRATFLAERKMEETRSLINSDNASYGYTKSYTQSATAFPAPDSLYKFTITDDGGSDIKVLNVSVWDDVNGNDVADGDEYSVALDTKVANRD